MKKLSILVGIVLVSIFAFGQKNLTKLGQLTYTPTLNDIWGYSDSAAGEYALVGVRDGFSIVDISVPSTPVQLFFISGPTSTWRDIKTYNGYAYVVNESDSGMLIVDLNSLPASISYNRFSDTGNIWSAHNIYIDENGFAYCWGYNNLAGNIPVNDRGAIIYDLNSSPTNPTLVGTYSTQYCHDGMVRGDTMWTSEIYRGGFGVIDVSTKSNPVVLATQNTPFSFAHNCWISDDGDYLFVTEEISGAYVLSYDVSDLGNIRELDRWQPPRSSGVIPHNTHYRDRYVITSYYTDGVNILDVKRPDNMVEIGHYDSSPSTGGGYIGNWGAFPWLGSGNIIITDGTQGLFILGPTYIPACWLEGSVCDSMTSNPLINVDVEILTTGISKSTNLSGDYKTGYSDAGSYSVRFTKAGYFPKTVTGVVLQNDSLTMLNVCLSLLPQTAVSGTVLKLSDNTPIANAEVLIQNNTFSYTATTDIAGNFNMVAVYFDTFNVYAGKWSFVTNGMLNQNIDSQSNSFTIYLDEGYYDDFIFDFGWTVVSTAPRGKWEKGEPIGTTYNGDDCNPDDDVYNDFGVECFMTGNGGGSAGFDDVDNGKTTLTSPAFDLTNYITPYISYNRWFFNDGGFGQPDDSLIFYITNGIQTAKIENITSTIMVSGKTVWRPNNFKVSDYVIPTAAMWMFVECVDANNGHLVEGGLDVWQIADSGNVSTNELPGFQSLLSVYPNPFDGSVNVKYIIDQFKNNYLVVSDLFGREVEQIHLSGSSGTLLILNDIPQGVYFLRIQNESDISEVTKLIKY